MCNEQSSETSRDQKDRGDLRTGFTTGACATAAAAAAAARLLTGAWTNPTWITLPIGRRVAFALAECEAAADSATAGVVKDAGDDPDVTHGALILATVTRAAEGAGLRFVAGEGVGVVTRPGLPIPPGEPAINPVPRQMMTAHLEAVAAAAGAPADFEVTLRVPGGAALAAKTWNPRLGIEGGISILGTTGVVKPYSCAAWIASIHRGIDVARAGGAAHAAASTGATSERAAQAALGLPDWAMLDMGDFVGGMLKYLRRHPLPRLTVAGGFAKMTKLAQGALDLHSSRSQVDMAALGAVAAAVGADGPAVAAAPTAMAALEIGGAPLAEAIAAGARRRVEQALEGAPVRAETMIVDRSGRIVARTS